MTIIGVKQLIILLFAIGKSCQALDWSNFRIISGDAIQNSYEIQSVASTSELDALMDSISDYFYYSQSGSRRNQYKQSVQKIVIGQNPTMKKISTKVFEKFTNLNEFQAINVSLEEINRDDFQSAKNLQKLVLARNQIKRLDNMVFMHLKKLVELDLSSNQISFVHDNAFEGIVKSIKSVDLSNNKIASFKEDSLILLLQNVDFIGKSFENYVTVNLGSNEIEEVVASNKTVTRKLPIMNLNLMNNKLKEFNCSAIKYMLLDLQNNEIENLSLDIAFLSLNVSNNKLSELFIKNSTVYINAANNQLINLTIATNSKIEFLRLSGNKLRNEALLQLKGLKWLQTLDLSATALSALNVDTFADLESLKSLRLDQNNILSIGHGVFAHQSKLIDLNISRNALQTIDLHVLGALSSLEKFDISGNNISSIKDYESFRQILPELLTIGLEENFWNCGYLSKMKNSLMSQNISIDTPQNPIKNKSNFLGIECHENSTELMTHVEAKNDDAISLKMNAIVDKLNDLNLKLVENEAKTTQQIAEVKYSVAALKRENFELKSANLSSQLSTVNSTNINEVRSLVEQMNNVTLEKQKLAYDQLVHKINEQNVEISKYKVETEKLILSIKGDSIRSDAVATPQASISTPSNGFTSLETLVILFFFATVTFALVLAVFKAKKYFNSKLDKIARQRISRRNSVSTVVTYDNSNT